MPLHDFRCAAGHVAERRVARGVEAVPCACGQEARRAVVEVFAQASRTPPGVPIAHYYEAAQEAQYAHDRTDDPLVRAQTRPEVWKPALYRARNKTREQALGFRREGDRTWADPRPYVTEREIAAEVR